MAEQIFRKAALERLSSPEELDTLMQVTTPKGWVALLSLGVLLVLAAAWGFYGRIPTKVQGQGILLKPGGVLDIVSLTGGQITAIYPAIGETVEKGQVVARVAQPKTIDEISRAKATLNDLKAEQDRISKYGSKDIATQKEYLAKRRTEVERSVQIDRGRLKWLNELLASRKQLLEKGLITRQTVIKTQEDIYLIQQEIEKFEGDIKQLSIQEQQVRELREREQLTTEQKISQQERIVGALEYDLEENSRVLSPHRGHVLEITASEGKPVERGTGILTLERVDDVAKDLEALVYMSPDEGKKVRPGMGVHVTPSSVRQEESGSILGIVTRVSEFPATPKGMMKGLQNESLVQSLSSGGAPIEVYVDLIPDPNTESGYKWSSPKGPLMKIQSGTLCAAAITIEEQRPISLVIPLLKKHVLGIGQTRVKEGGNG